MSVTTSKPTSNGAKLVIDMRLSTRDHTLIGRSGNPRQLTSSSVMHSSAVPRNSFFGVLKAYFLPFFFPWSI